ncbi:MAG: GLUG motif-containing protein, partial [Bacillota bacterium]|nr:GLUG motif-containing protein [Bacillota bacterium]
SYEAGTNITISAVAYEGYEFIEWKDGEDQIATAASFGYTTTSDNKTFTAYFESTSEFAGGNGTKSDPYLVETAEQLDKVRDYLDAHFKQIADIDLGVSPWNEGEGWEPIGTSENQFLGLYNGQGFKIENLSINRSLKDNIGLFGITNGTIQKVEIINASVIGRNYVGSLVGSSNGVLNQCYSSGSVNGRDFVGGLAGASPGSGALIQQSFSMSSVEGTGDVGGLVGMTYGLVTQSYATGSVSGNRAGGLIGACWMSVSNSYASGKVTGTTASGGLIGQGGYGLSGVYYDQDTTENSDVGKGVPKSTNEMIQQSTFIEWDFDSIWTIKNGESYPYLQWQGNENIPYTPSPFAGGSGTEADPYQVETADQLDEVRNFLDAHFIQIADIDLADYVTEGGIFYNSGEGWEPIGNSSNKFQGFYDGDGYTISNLYINRDINEVGLFGCISELSVLQNLSLLSVNTYGNSINGGLLGYNFGTINSITVSGIVKGDYSDTGLLVGRNKGEIYNSSSSGEVRGSLSTLSSSPNVGGLVGNNAGASSNITNCFSTAEVYGIYEMGGLVGYNEGSISNSYSKGHVSGSYYYLGGLVGSNTGIIDLCYSESNVSNTSHYSGGLVGRNFGQIRKSYSLGSLNSSGAVVGGLTGLNYGLITDCYSHSNVHGNLTVGGLVGSNTYSDSPYLGEIINSYSTGSVSFNNNTKIGGLIGSMNSDTVTSSYWDTETSGLTSSAGGVGKTTAEMQNQSTYTDTDWDFTDIWNIDTGTSYPYLKNNEQLPHPSPYDFIVYNKKQYDDTVNQNGDLNYLLSSGPTLGTLVFNSDGSFSYTSNQSDDPLKDTDSFSYTVNGSEPVYIKIKILPSRI